MTESIQTPTPSSGTARAIGLVHPVDLVVTLIILSGVSYLFYETTTFAEVAPMFAQNIQPSMYPQILLIIIGALAVFLPFEHILLTRKGKDIDKERRDSIPRLTLFTMAFLIAIVAAAETLGILLTMITISLIMPRLWGQKKLVPTLMFATIFPVLVVLLFSKILSVYFDPGLFGIAL